METNSLKLQKKKRTVRKTDYRVQPLSVDQGRKITDFKRNC